MKMLVIQVPFPPKCIDVNLLDFGFESLDYAPALFSVTLLKLLDKVPNPDVACRRKLATQLRHPVSLKSTLG